MTTYPFFNLYRLLKHDCVPCIVDEYSCSRGGCRSHYGEFSPLRLVESKTIQHFRLYVLTASQNFSFGSTFTSLKVNHRCRHLGVVLVVSETVSRQQLRQWFSLMNICAEQTKFTLTTMVHQVQIKSSPRGDNPRIIGIVSVVECKLNMSHRAMLRIGNVSDH